jgi:2-keto-4-pentenoate hydratase/2-oxohepta-3-ene-1,7-dioic acid hydratase in catechol pathway
MVDRVRGSTESVPVHTGVTNMLDYEAELAVIIGRAGHDIDPGSVPEYIFGYSILNDITARDLQKSHDQWFKGKSLDGACAMGPVIVTADEIAYPPALDIGCSVNGELRQKAVTSDLIFGITEIVSDFSRGLTLMPDDIISTGTPAGVGMGFRSGGSNPVMLWSAGSRVSVPSGIRSNKRQAALTARNRIQEVKIASAATEMASVARYSLRSSSLIRPWSSSSIVAATEPAITSSSTDTILLGT